MQPDPEVAIRGARLRKRGRWKSAPRWFNCMICAENPRRHIGLQIQADWWPSAANREGPHHRSRFFASASIIALMASGVMSVSPRSKVIFSSLPVNGNGT